MIRNMDRAIVSRRDVCVVSHISRLDRRASVRADPTASR
jgi:hypothetical protein